MDILEFCREVAENIHTYENDAKKALTEDNTKLYIDLMRKKALLLSSLAMEIPNKNMKSIPANAQVLVIKKLSSFSQSAQNAIQLDSVWYMSQLLFDEDYKDGEPNNFDLFLQELESIK